MQERVPKKWALSYPSLQALIPICSWLMVIPWCISMSGCRGWLLRYFNHFLYGDIGLLRSYQALSHSFHTLVNISYPFWTLLIDCHYMQAAALYWFLIKKIWLYWRILNLQDSPKQISPTRSDLKSRGGRVEKKNSHLISYFFFSDHPANIFYFSPTYIFFCQTPAHTFFLWPLPIIPIFGGTTSPKFNFFRMH